MTDLTTLPQALREDVETFAQGVGEELVGWKYITKPMSALQVEPHRLMVITTVGYYEFDLDGVCQRAAVLHQF